MFEPNNEFVGAAVELFPKEFELEVEGGLLVAPNRPPPCGLGLFEDAWPNKLLEPSLVAGVPNEKVGRDLGGSMVIIVRRKG